MFSVDAAVVQMAITTLGLTLLHFLWQGLLIGVAYLILVRLMRNALPHARYLTGVATLLIMFLTPIATGYWLFKQASIQAVDTAAGAIGTLAPAMVQAQTATGASFGLSLSMLPPLVVAVWLAGVLVLAGRMVLDARQLNRLRRNADPRVPGFLANALDEICARLGLAADRVSIGITNEVSTAIVTGWLRPMILMPAAILTCLPRDQIELILVHELAHIRRRDHLVNLLQVVVETTLFYHPMVRIVSNSVRNEREHATDDLVLDIREDRISYARALTRLEQFRGDLVRLSVGSAGGDFTARIQRLFQPKVRYQKGTVAAVLVLVMTVSSLLGANLAVWSMNGNGAEQEPAEEARVSDTTGDAAPPLLFADEAGTTPDNLIESIEPDQPEIPARPAPRPEPAQTMERLAQTARDLPQAGVQTDAEPAPTGQALEATESRDGTARTAPPRPESPAAVAIEPDPGVREGADESAVEPDATPETVPETIGAEPETGLKPLELAMIRQPSSRSEARAEPVYTGGTLIAWQEPEYPRFAMHRGRESVVRLAFTIDTSGRVRDIEVLSADNANYGFGQAAADAVQHWRYEPFTVDGEPVDRTVQQEVQFRLDDEFHEQGECGPVTGRRLNYC